jgi:hypothetical protein
MRVTLTNEDGSEVVREVASISIEVGDWPLDIKPGGNGRRLALHVPAKGDAFCGFVVHHRCANTMGLELAPNPGPDEG